MGKNVLEDFPNLNELAHDHERELTRLGGLEAKEEQERPQQNDALLTFNEKKLAPSLPVNLQMSLKDDSLACGESEQNIHLMFCTRKLVKSIMEPLR